MAQISPEFSATPHFLSEEELEKLASYSLNKRRREWLAGRFCLKRSVSDFLDEHEVGEKSLRKYIVHNRNDGRPFLLGYEQEISISHSKDFALAMCTEQPCGIDIQQAVATLEKVEDRYCNDVESKILSTLTATKRLHQLAMLWSCKEAIQKALSCHEKMPGFLELVLSDIVMKENFYLFSLSYTTKSRRRVFKVPVAQYNNYALAYLILEENQCQNSLK